MVLDMLSLDNLYCLSMTALNGHSVEVLVVVMLFNIVIIHSEIHCVSVVIVRQTKQQYYANDTALIRQ